MTLYVYLCVSYYIVKDRCLPSFILQISRCTLTHTHTHTQYYYTDTQRNFAGCRKWKVKSKQAMKPHREVHKLYTWNGTDVYNYKELAEQLNSTMAALKCTGMHMYNTASDFDKQDATVIMNVEMAWSCL